MKKRKPEMYEKMVVESTITVIGLNERPQRGSRRVMHFLGKMFGWFFSHVPGILFIVYGTNGLRTGQVRIKWGRMLRGEDAISFSWVMIGIGIWFVCRYGHLFQFRPRLRLLGYLSATAAFAFGILILVKQLTAGLT